MQRAIGAAEGLACICKHCCEHRVVRVNTVWSVWEQTELGIPRTRLTLPKEAYKVVPETNLFIISELPNGHSPTGL